LRKVKYLEKMNESAVTTNAREELSALLSVFIAQAMSYDTDTLLRFVKQADLTLPLLSVLSLVERQGAMSIGDLSAGLDYSLPNASLLVDKLVCQKCVTRVENASDRRHKLVRLTSKGQSLLTALRVARADSLAHQLLLLPPDVLTQTIALLRAITHELPLPETQGITEAVGPAAT
jgi:DNA-binding MarR family transcriptional regulator